MKPVSLKISPEVREDLACCCAPTGVKPYYPSVCLEFKSDVAPELPEEGTITFRYKVRRETDIVEDNRSEYSLELRSIEAVKEGSSGEDEDEGAEETAGDVLDKYRDEASDE
jgi:hypothetical protein